MLLYNFFAEFWLETRPKEHYHGELTHLCHAKILSSDFIILPINAMHSAVESVAKTINDNISGQSCLV